MAHLMLFLSYLLVLAALQELHAVQYTVTNNAAGTPGGNLFDKYIGIDYSRQTLESASSFIWQTFRQATEADRKNVQSVSFFVDSMDGVNTTNNEIHMRSNNIASYSGDIKTEITGLLYHGMTHIWQWNGNGQTPVGLFEGIADYVRLKAGLVPSYWVQPGGGDRWDQGYDVTAQFLDYCDSLKEGFVADLNGKMRTGYNVNFFVDLLGKTVDQLWNDYRYALNVRNGEKREEKYFSFNFSCL